MKASLFLLTAFGAAAVFAVEQKHSWFDLDIGDMPSSTRYWPTDGSNYEAYHCFVTNTAAGVFLDNPNRIAFDAEEPVSVIPDDVAQIDTVTYAEISVTMEKMEPFGVSDLPEVPEGAKTAAIVVDSGAETNFWVAAGAEGSLCWTNTEVAADIASQVEIKVRISYGSGETAAHWSFGNQEFTSIIPNVRVLTGVAFRGSCELSSCWADVLTLGRLVDFWIAGIPDDVNVAVTTTNGDELARSDLGSYHYFSGGTVNLAFSLPEGWRYADGALKWQDVIAKLDSGEYVPFGGRGIFDTDYGPVGYWMVVPFEGPVQRFAALDDALATQKDYCALMSCYSETPHEISVADDGKSITVDGVQKTAKSRYHFFSADGMPVLQINEEEAEITSILESAGDLTKMSIGSVLNTFEGFNYSVIFADDVGFTTGCGETEPVPGDGGKLELAAPKGENGQRFYRIRITD